MARKVLMSRNEYLSYCIGCRARVLEKTERKVSRRVGEVGGQPTPPGGYGEELNADFVIVRCTGDVPCPVR
jgi:hypothetical protein